LSDHSANWSADFANEISFADGSFVDLGLHQNQMAIMPLVFIRGDEIRPLGTCFSITNDGLCMTARHVIEEGVTLSAPPQRKTELDPERDGYFGALYISPEIHPEEPENLLGGFLPMYAIYTIDILDIALIKLSLPTDARTGELLRFPAHPLRLRPPVVGEFAFALGYRAMTWEVDHEAKRQTLQQKYSATKAVVEEVHLGGRDRVMLPFPSFRIAGRIDGGMSGGPMLDAQGQVMGVVCSSIPRGEDAQDSSYGSLIAPAMGMTLTVRDRDGGDRQAFLWDLVEGGPITVDRENVTVTRTGDDIQLALRGFHLNARLGS